MSNMKLKHRKTIFLALMTLTAGGSIAAYGAIEGDFLTKTIQLMVVPQLVGAIAYFGCFGVEPFHGRSPFE
jgi:putative effector of murein hydrolase LrgA (UPF0299 family)